MVSGATWQLKKCPRCHGDVYLDDDLYGKFEKCLQCGFVREITSPISIEQAMREALKPNLAGYHNKKRGAGC